MFSKRFGIHGYIGTLIGGPSVAILLHFDGENESTAFLDSSENSWTVTGGAGTIISTAESKFGGSSLLTDYGPVTIAANAALDLGENDWTIELFYYQTGGGYVLAAQWENGNAWFISHNALFINGNGALSWTTPDNEVWHHVAIVRKGNMLSGFIDGIMIGSMEFIVAVNSSSGDIGVGGGGGQPGIYGYVDDFRLVKGLAVYDGDFIVPDSALTTNAVAYTNYKTYGTLLFSECVDGDLVGTYADGNGGRYTETISVGSC